MQKGENSEKISPKIFIWAGIVIIAIFFTSIIFTAVDMIEYRYSRIVTYSTVVMAVSLYIIYAILDQKHLILDVPQKEQVKYLIAVTLVVTLLEVLVFFMCYVVKRNYKVLVISMLLWGTFFIIGYSAEQTTIQEICEANKIKFDDLPLSKNVENKVRIFLFLSRKL
jgi:hypothetical protein